MPNASGGWMNVPSWAIQQYNNMPDDFEKVDEDGLRILMEKYLQETYPDFEPEIVYGLEGKEYFLPALKVLKKVDDKFFSPGYEALWQDGELKAECRTEGRLYSGYISDREQDNYIHSAPHEACECGIYGSVNLEEILEYTKIEYKSNMYVQYLPTFRFSDDYLNFDESYPVYREPKIQNILCIVEPSPDAKVIVCRKGWKASHAFISEIVGDTISVDDTSQLLSIAWKRTIDLRRIL